MLILKKINRTICLTFCLILVLLSVSCIRTDIDALKDEGNVNVLIKRLKHVTLGKDAAQALVEIGEPAVEPLIEVLNWRDGTDPAISAKILAADALAQIGDKRAIEPLIAKLGMPNIGVNNAIATALVQFSNAHIIEALIETIWKVPNDVPTFYEGMQMMWAGGYIRALSEIGFPAVDPLLTVVNNKSESLNENDLFLQQAALLALQNMSTGFAKPVCEGEAILANPYNSERKGIHPIVIIFDQEKSNEMDIENFVPEQWIVSGDPKSFELVLCVNKTASNHLETCKYTDGSSIDRIKKNYYFSIRVASSGVEIGSIEIEGNNPPPCPQSKKLSQSNYKIYAGGWDSVDILLEWLGAFVNITE